MVDRSADRVHRCRRMNVQPRLFHGETAPVDLVKWKDVYGLLEATIDQAEDVANIIERITIKHA